MTRALALLLAAMACHPAHAQQLYKWVDSEGRVTYSSTPPPSGARAETVAEPPKPTREEVEQTESRLKREREAARKLEQQRLEQEAARREREAEEARLRAQENPPTVVIEKPVYVPQPVTYPPVMAPPPRPAPPPQPLPIPGPR